MPTIFVTGSTGAIGSPTVRSLASKPGVSVRAGIHARRAKEPSAQVEWVAVDFMQPDTLRAAMAGIDALFMITPSVPNQVQLAERVLDAAKAARVPRMVRLSAIHADDPSIEFIRQHAEIEKRIVDSGIPATFLRPNSYMTNFIHHHGPDAQGNIYLPWGQGGVSLIDPRDVADVATMLLTDGGHAGKGYTLTGAEALTVDQVASEIGQATGRTIRYVDVPEDATRQGMLGHGVPPIVVEPLMELFASCKAGRHAAVTPTFRELTGRAPRTFREFARDHAEAWASRARTVS